MTQQEIIEEDLKILPGTGATMRVGSDSYPWYVSEVASNGIIGMYKPKSWFDDKHPWEGGMQVVAPFDAKHPSEIYIKRRYGKWWKVSNDGKPISRFTSRYESLHFNGAYSYCDPSF